MDSRPLTGTDAIALALLVFGLGGGAALVLIFLCRVLKDALGTINR